jgi:hypothetical protein
MMMIAYLIQTIPPISEFLSPDDVMSLQDVNVSFRKLCQTTILPFFYVKKFRKRWDKNSTLCCEYFVYGQIFMDVFKITYPDNWTVWIDTASTLMHQKKTCPKLCVWSLYDWFYQFFYRYSWTNFLYTHDIFLPNILYFEVTLVSPLSEEENDCLTLGYMKKKEDVFPDGHHYLLGWSSHSIGLHSDDGYVYYNSEKLRYYDTFSQSDTIGFGVYLDTEEYFITKNGRFISQPQPLPFSLCHLQPSVITDGLVDYTVRYGHKTPFLSSLVFDKV